MIAAAGAAPAAADRLKREGEEEKEKKSVSASLPSPAGGAGQWSLRASQKMDAASPNGSRGLLTLFTGTSKKIEAKVASFKHWIDIA